MGSRHRRREYVRLSGDFNRHPLRSAGANRRSLLLGSACLLFCAAANDNNLVIIMSPRTQPASLGEFELLVLLATLSLGGEAYPVSIAADIETRTGRRASRTSVLITLERLEDKELVTSRYGDPTPQRGGRAKRYFRATPRGVQAVREALKRIETMTHGLGAVLRAR
jgi:PadR family transcriptional regulator, regulatory protein PadR